MKTQTQDSTHAKQQIVELAKQLIERESTFENPFASEECLRLINEQLDDFNYQIFENNGIKSLLAYNRSTIPDNFHLILNGHVDVVPGETEQFLPQVEGGKLYGRGAYDMKSAVAAFVQIFKELGNEVDYPLGLQIVTDEEIAGKNGTKYQIEQGITSDFVISGEQTDLQINNEAKGIAWIRLKSQGVSGHSAYPWRGSNGLLPLVNTVQRIESAEMTNRTGEWRTTWNLSWISTPNKAPNKIPDQGEALFDVRFVPDDEMFAECDQAKIIGQLSQYCEDGVTVEIDFCEPAQFTKKTNGFVDSLQSLTKKVTGEEGQLVRMCGSSDIRHFNEAGMDGVTFGPRGEGAHSDSEYVELSSLENYYQVVHDFVASLSG